jgi:hypothetical protein
MFYAVFMIASNLDHPTRHFRLGPYWILHVQRDKLWAAGEDEMYGTHRGMFWDSMTNSQTRPTGAGISARRRMVPMRIPPRPDELSNLAWADSDATASRRLWWKVDYHAQYQRSR